MDVGKCIIPFNAMFVFAVCIAYLRRKDFDGSILLLVRFKLFFQRWRPDRWYWGWFFCLRQMLFACMLFVGNDAAEQITFAVSVLSIYNVGLALLFPWRMFEINVIEFVMTILLVFVLVYMFGVVPRAANENKFRNAVTTLVWLIMCVGVCYVGRVCWGAALVGGRPNQIFVGWPKRLDHRKMSKTLEVLCMTGLDAATTENLIGNCTDFELKNMEKFCNAMQTVSCQAFDFDVDVGLRMYVPSEYLHSKQNRADMAAAIQGKRKHNESYI